LGQIVLLGECVTALLSAVMAMAFFLAVRNKTVGASYARVTAIGYTLLCLGSLGLAAGRVLLYLGFAAYKHALLVPSGVVGVSGVLALMAGRFIHHAQRS